MNKTRLKNSWKQQTKIAQNNICYLCGGKVSRRKASWDHIVPKSIVLPTPSNNPPVGTQFLTHKKCNTVKSNTLPSSAQIEKAFSIIKNFQHEDTRDAAHFNLSEVLKKLERINKC